MIKLLLTDTSTDASSWMMIAFLVICIVAMYVFSSRSQKKRQAKAEEMIAKLEVGSKIKTIGGIYGTIEAIDEDSFVIKSGEGDMVGYLKISKNAVYASDNPATEVDETKTADESSEIYEVQSEDDEI